MSAVSKGKIPIFLLGGGEMGERIREFDWTKTPLGNPEGWEQSLKTCVRIMLSSSQPIWIGWGKELIKLYNDPYKSIAGGKHPAALGQPVSMVWKDIWTDIEPMLKKVMEHDEGTYVESQLLIMERNGYPEETYYTFSYTPVPGDNGVTAGVFCANTDDTSRVINERALETLRSLGKISYKKKKLAEIYAKTAAILAENNKDFPFALFYEITGNEAKQVAWAGNENDYNYFPQVVNIKEPTEQTQNICKAIKTNENVISLNKGRRPNAPKGYWDKVPEQILHIPLCISNSNCPNAVLTIGLNPYRNYDSVYQSFIRLLTDQVLLEMNNMHAMEEERKRGEALTEIDKAKTVFFNNISHEFRTPLTLMLGPLEELMRQPEEEIKPQYLKGIETTHRNAVRLLKLVNTLLDFSRIESGRQEANFTRVDIAGFTKNLVASFESVIEKAGLKFNINIQYIREPVYMDKAMWEKIVFNLLSNAFKYTLEGSITLNLYTEKNRLILQVADTGVGIPESELPKMFERFHRVKGTSGRSYEGTGIGLSLIKELVRLHGGTIEVDSTTEKDKAGSTFTVKIPTGKEHLSSKQLTEVNKEVEEAISNIYTQEAEALIETTTAKVNGKEDNSFDHQPITVGGQTDTKLISKDESILVVDDNADMRAYLKTLLQKNYTVIVAKNGKEALEKILQNPPHLVLSDIMMPVMDGVQLLKEIKQNRQTAHIPVILLSARAGEEAKIEGYDIGADDYLVKPFSSKELLSRVRAQIKIVELRNELEGNVRNLFMQAPAIICVLRGPCHIYELANERYMGLIGHRNIIGKPIREALPELEGSGIYEILDDVYRTGTPFFANDRPVMLKRENGKLEESIFNFIYQPSRNASREIDGILVYAVDVTEESIARKKIEESEKHLSNILSQVNAGIAQTDSDGKFVEVNERYCEITGYSKEELLQLNLADITHPEDLQKNLNLFTKCKDEGKDYIIEKRYIRKDGSVVWVNMSVTLIEDAVGKKYITGVCIDITSTKEQEQKIQQLLINEQKNRHEIEESEFRYHNLIHTSTSMILILEGENLIVRVANDSMLKTLGKGNNIIGKPLLSVIPEIIEQGLGDILHEVYRTGEPHYGYELPVYIIRNGKKELSYYTFVYQAQRDHDGNIEGVAVIAAEVTPQAELNKKIRESEQRFRNIVEQAPDPILILKGENMTLEVANDPLLKVWNIDKSSFGKPFLEILPEMKGQGFLETLRDVYFNDKILKGEETPAVFTGKNGKKRVLYFNYVYQPYREDDGTISGVLVLATDVTKQVIAQQKIRESEKNYRHLVTHLPVALYTCDAAGHILLYNQAAINLWGRVPQAGIEKWNGAFRLYKADGSPLPLDKAPMAIALKEGRIEQFEIIIERRDGSRRNVIPFPQLLYGTDGKISGALNMMHDITEEKKAAANNAILASIVQSSDDAIISKSTKGIITSWNPSAERMFGFTTEEMIGQSILKIIPPGRLEEETYILSQLQAGKSIDHFETKRLIKSGNTIDISLTISPIRDKEGKIIGISKIARDITEAKKAESLLRISENRFRTLTGSLPQLIWTADKDGTVDFFSQQWYDYTGSTPDESFGNNWQQYIYPQHVAKVLSRWQHSRQTGKPIVVEFQLRAKDDSYKWFYVIGNPIKDASGDIIKWIGALTDIDEQKKTETILKESEKRFRLLAESLPQLVWVTDEKGNSEFVSLKWEEYTGFRLSMLDEKWKSIVHPDDLETIMQIWKESLITCIPYKSEVRLKSKTGEYRWFAAIGEPVFNNENKVIKWVGAFSDIHHLKKEQQRKDAFLSMASHELKTPVTTIKAYGEIAELMLEQKGDEQTLAIQRKMSKQVNKLTTLITDLLDNIRVEKGKLIYTETRFDFNDLVRDIVDDMQKINPHFKITYHSDKEVKLFGDMDKIGQVINNLITNAIKYAPGTDEIILDMKIENEGVHLSVKDFGIGIPAEDQPHIFEQFYRVNGDSQSTFPGMGIGLYICSEIISRQGGKIWVESTMGKGSTFYIWLPFDYRKDN